MTVELTTLANGFRIVSEAMPGLHSTALGVWVTAGGRHEAPEENGIAHFLEHMAFKGTTTRSALEIAEAIEDVGGYLNAYTSREVTAYYARVLEGDVALALDVIADILLNPVFDPAEIEVERGVILQEIGQVSDTPDDLVFDKLQEVAYPGQALGRPILGTAERVRAFSRDDLMSFIARHYAPERMILAAAGAVDHAALARQAEASFGALTRHGREAVAPARFACGEWREIKRLEQVHLALAFEGPGYRADDFYAAQVYSTAMGGGMSSRLFQEAREKRGLCYSIFAQTGAYADTGMTTIYAGTSASDIAELMALTADELRRAADGISEAEVARARAQLKAGLLMGLESPSARAERAARMLAIWGRVPPISETIERIDAVDVAAVRAFAARTAEASAAMAVIGPADAAPPLEALRERLAA
ncbi:Predicted Zn-dependent peptidase [Meinhardsimonia xiamenensis]|uniref:Predicted Zn-dependent peptidase n=1 Tax=Meinhardsimonia xiamenensis TaxID=990712 RepID=A0A1G9CP85_9RHOB|nr:pitrilysin family protein [Meinhardsimonia xiamenensis]PRX38290.1 putative Zn-dependent peptidase [Meinhardsimonia xiamenensis]SDK53523.1 Predicted Zn-dependent peptidase [Meinhardsimonia xiamenensis]